MKFTEKYPELVDPTKRFPEKMLGPHPEVICGSGIAQTWRMYPCASCKVVTGFRLELGDDFPMVPCCSEECAADLRLPFVPDAVIEVEMADEAESFDEMFVTSGLANLAESQIVPDPEKNSTEDA